MKQSILDFYTEQGERTKIDKKLAEQFPKTPEDLVPFIQRTIVHIGRVERESIESSKENREARDPVTVEDLLSKLKSQDFSAEIPLNERPVGICRNLTMLLVSLLREAGIPARSRCGFAIYFGGGYYEDHWIAEYWDADSKTWKRVDPQMDDYWTGTLHLDDFGFNGKDIKAGQFLMGGEAWKLYREGLIDPDICGFSRTKDVGDYYVRDNMLRDFFALNKMEYVYEEASTLMEEDYKLSKEDLKLLDHIADVASQPDKRFAELRDIFQNEKEIDP
jgi:hypothetical protein